MSSNASPTFISRLGVFASNVGHMFADVAHGLVDSYLLCGGDEPIIDVASGLSVPTSGAKTVRTFQDVWQRCTHVHGERTMNIIFFVFVLSIALAFLYVIVGLVNIFKSPSATKKVGVTPPKKKGASSSAPHSTSKSKTESAEANGHESAETDPHPSESFSSSSPSSSPLGPDSTSKRESIAAITSSDAYRFAKALIDGSAECSNAIVGPTPSSQLFASSSSSSSSPTVIKASNKVAFPSKVGVMLTSPCQQYWLISCRATLETRVYPQNHKPQFLTKGQDLSKKLYLSLGYLIGPVVGSTTTAVGSKTCPAVDISIASFLSSTPLSSLQFSSTDDSRVGAQSQSSQQQADPLLNDTSSTYLAVGESQKDTFVILRLTTSTTPISAAGTMEDSPANDSRSEGSRHAAGKMLFAHYKTTPVRAEVLWLYRRSTNRLVWDTYRFGLFSSFSCAPTARIPSASCGLENSRRGCIFGAGAGAEDSLLMSEADQHMYSSDGGVSSSSSLATIADILVFANSDDTSVEMIHRTHVGDGYELTPWGSYKSEKEKTSSSSAAKGNSGKKGAAKGTDTSNAANVNNPVRTVLAEADTDWHPQHLKAGQSHATRNRNTNKFSVGHCTAMQLSDPLILCCGSFTTEPSLSQLSLPRYPLAAGSAGPSTVKELLQTYAIDRLFPSEAMRPKGHSSHHHASSLATSAASVPPQRLRIPRVVPAYLSELSGLVGSVLKNASISSTSSSVSSSFFIPTEELLARFIHQSSTSASSASASFTRSGFAVQQVAVINPFQPASTLSYNSGSGHRPCICVVFCDNGCGFVYDLASYWESGGGSGNVLSAGSSNSTTSDEMLRSYAVYSGVDSPSSSGKSSSLPPVNPTRRAADKPIATFFDLAFARKEVKVSSSSSSAHKETVVIGGCDLMSVCVTGAGPRYGLRIALVNKARRAVSIYGTRLSPQGDGKGGALSAGGRGVSYVDAPLTDGLVKFLIEEGSSTNDKAQRRLSSDIASFATSQKNLPANTNAVSYTDAFSCAPSAETGVLPALVKWTTLHPSLNKYGEPNSIEHLCFIQNGLGVATVGKEDGLGILMHSLP